MIHQFVGFRHFHHPAEIHHGDAVGNVVHDQQVMGNKQVCYVQLLLQVLKHIDDLGLNGHVKGRHGLVADDELGTNRQSAGYADSLPLPA